MELPSSEIRPAPPWLMQLLFHGRQPAVPIGQPHLELPAGIAANLTKKMPGEELADIQGALAAVPAWCTNQEWIQIGWALHDHTHGSEEGFQLWHAWAAQAAGMFRKNAAGQNAPVYPGEEQHRYRWRKFSSQRPKTKGIRTLFEVAGQHGYRGPAAVAAPPVVRAAPPAQPAAVNGANGHAAVVAPPLPDFTGGIILPPLDSPLQFDPEEIAAAMGGPRDPGPYPQSIIQGLSGPMKAMQDWIVRASRRQDPVIAFAATLGAVSAMLGRRVLGPQETRPMLCIAMLAPSGSGKDKPQECVKNLLDANPNLLVAMMNDTPTHRTQLDEAMLANRGQAMMMLDEYGSTLNRWLKPGDMLSSSLSPAIRQLATHGMSRYRLAQVSLKHPSRAADPAAWDAGIFAPSMTLVGFATPGQFYEALSEPALVDGFLGRHLLIHSESALPLVDPTCASNAFPPEVMAWAQSIQAEAIPSIRPPVPYMVAPPPGVEIEPEGPQWPRVIPWASPAAAAMHREIVVSIDQAGLLAVQEGDEVKTAILRRMPGQVSALALVLACGQAWSIAGAAVDEHHLEAAYRAARWSADHLAFKLRHGVAMDEFGRAYDRICQAIERAGGAPVWRSKMASKRWAVPLIGRIWKEILLDPRFIATERWARLRTPADLGEAR